uniref:Uncharacterized protein n=1 Tax=Glossina brevipalpis TaxID=37001 RepID=A0A1A9W6L1_9MUSC
MVVVIDDDDDESDGDYDGSGGGGGTETRVYVFKRHLHLVIEENGCIIVSTAAVHFLYYSATPRHQKAKRFSTSKRQKKRKHDGEQTDLVRTTTENCKYIDSLAVQFMFHTNAFECLQSTLLMIKRTGLGRVRTKIQRGPPPIGATRVMLDPAKEKNILRNKEHKII